MGFGKVDKNLFLAAFQYSFQLPFKLDRLTCPSQNSAPCISSKCYVSALKSLQTETRGIQNGWEEQHPLV